MLHQLGILGFVSKINAEYRFIYSGFGEEQKSGAQDLEVYTDVSYLGAGAFYAEKWVFYPWPKGEKKKFGIKWIIQMEYVPVYLAAKLWASNWVGRRTTFHLSDRLVMNGIWAPEKNPPIVEYSYLLTHKNITSFLDYTSGYFIGRPGLWPGPKSNAARLIAHGQMDDFHEQFPEADSSTTPLPEDKHLSEFLIRGW